MRRLIVLIKAVFILAAATTCCGYDDSGPPWHG
jgi:hypothetical protein